MFEQTVAFLFCISNLPAPCVARAQSHVDSRRACRSLNLKGYSLGPQSGYYWLSDRSILICRNVVWNPARLSKTASGAISTSGGISYGGNLCVVNWPDGRVRILRRVSALFAKEHGRTASLSPSQDGRYLAWRGDHGSFVSSIATGRTVRLPGLDAPHWVNGTTVLFDVEETGPGRPEVSRLYRLSSRLQLKPIPFAGPEPIDADLLGITSQLVAVSATLTVRMPDKVTILLHRLYDTRSPAVHPVRFRPKTLVAAVILSPNGTRLLWILAPNYTGQIDEEVRAEFWRSRIDGTGMTPIGSTPTRSVRDAARLAAWLPGCRAVSFVDQGILRTFGINGKATRQQ